MSYPNLIQSVVYNHRRFVDLNSYRIIELNILYLLFSFVNNSCNICFNCLSFALPQRVKSLCVLVDYTCGPQWLTSLLVTVKATTNFCLQGLPSLAFNSAPSSPCRTQSLLVDFANTDASALSNCTQSAATAAKINHKNFIAAINFFDDLDHSNRARRLR